MTKTITFLPSGKIHKVPAGALLSDIASMITESGLHLECGGKGTCGTCMVELVCGTIEIRDKRISVDEGEQPRQVLSCQSVIVDDATVALLTASTMNSASLSLGKDIAAIDPALLPDKCDISPVVKRFTLRVAAPSLEQNLSDFQRLEKRVQKEFGSNAPPQVGCGLPQLQTLSTVLREKDGEVTVWVREYRGALDIVDVAPDGISAGNYGVSCDIGTTTISIHLVDMQTCAIATSKSDYNGQIRLGADVISRMEYAKTEKRLEEMRRLVVSTINGLINAACEEIGIPPQSIYNMAIAGNTTMMHLLLGLPPRHIRESPYVPTVNAPAAVSGADLCLAINPSAAITFAPGVGSYVGGDITSGLLTTPMIQETERISLFMDIGTNGEIAVGNAEFLMTCACSAGPAFEGSGIKCGMRAAAGAIESFEIDPSMENIRFSVIGNGAPKGICGSGLISLVAELYSKGIIDHSGRLSDKAPFSRTTLIEGTKGLVLVKAEEALDHKDIVVTEADIDNLVRTKGAMYAACDLMLTNIGLTFDAISHVYIAGGFGRFIDVEKAVRIGLLPDIARDKFTYLGNSSLTGATLALVSRDRRDELAAIAQRMTYIDLSGDPRYMDAYVAALFLPHTDLTRFPSTTKQA